MKTIDFAMLVNQFIIKYLVATRDLSPNTVLSYRDLIALLVTFMSNVHGKRPETLEIAGMIAERVEKFLGWLESERTNSPSTRGIRLAAIHSLFRYLCSQQPEHISHFQQILSIPIRKTAQTEVTYLDTVQTEKLLVASNTTTAKGRRDLTLLYLLCDNECRIQELTDVRISDIRSTVPPQVTLTGRGRKTRTVSPMKETAAILRNYIGCYSLDTPRWADMSLFFYHREEKLTRQGIAYVLQKYAEDAGIGKIIPHIPRHSKAVHLTEVGISSAHIRDFLGRTDLKATQIYSKTSIRVKRDVIEELAGQKVPLPETDSLVKTKSWVDGEDLMIWLNSLGH